MPSDEDDCGDDDTGLCDVIGETIFEPTVDYLGTSMMIWGPAAGAGVGVLIGATVKSEEWKPAVIFQPGAGGSPPGASGDDPKLLWELAAVHAIRGEREVAVAWLQQAHQAGWRWVGITELNPILDPVRDFPEFETALAEMRLQVKAMRGSVDEDPGS